MKTELLYKISLYNLSLIPLYLIFILEYVNIDSIKKLNSYEIVIANWKALFFLILILLGLLSYEVFKKNSNYGKKRTKKFQDVTPANFDHLTFLSTYILPLITFNLSEIRDFIVLLFLLLMIGIIYIKSNLYYLNPTLLLFGYKIYKAYIDEKSVILITKKDIKISEIISSYKDLGNNIYLLKE